ncbi:hypothetical protein W03_13600 [Nitrosomonas sp. PY1]|nr:hypothetical protein W03_13600 [Nitrosomonas sp. PY1]
MIYLYRAVDKYGDTLDFMLSERRDEEAVTHFFLHTVGSNGLPEKVVIDKSGANYADATLAGIETAHMIRKGQLNRQRVVRISAVC